MMTTTMQRIAYTHDFLDARESAWRCSCDNTDRALSDMIQHIFSADSTVAQNPVKSAELPSRIGMAKGMPSTSLQDWKAATAPLLPQKRRWYDAGGFPYRSACTKQPHYAHGCLYPSRWLPWLRRCAQRTQVYLKLMIIRVNLQFLYRRPNQYKRKLSEWDILVIKIDKMQDWNFLQKD
ncbi:Hypothetical_protein [Hexamita inflata]|uniref:Hypothetical_protein n=1 Tax=Hexamita inflata TaxID=28002 RepID=A0AA86UJ02_9EUKA|nr:Hypothetical protein HINF_LOCUS45269 [Hexamita inflata]